MTFPCDNLSVDIFRPSERGNAARIQHFETIFEEDLRQAFWIRFRIEDSSIFDDFMSKFRFELKFRWIQFLQKLSWLRERSELTPSLVAFTLLLRVYTGSEFPVYNHYCSALWRVITYSFHLESQLNTFRNTYVQTLSRSFRPLTT